MSAQSTVFHLHSSILSSHIHNTVFFVADTEEKNVFRKKKREEIESKNKFQLAASAVRVHVASP